MGIQIARSIAPFLLASLLLCTAAIPADADDQKLLAVDSNHVAIKGYDPVAYFTDSKAVKGSSAFEYVYDDAKWQFSSAAHRDLFASDPDRYMPQYGGFCAGAMVFGDLTPADPEAWVIVDGKLYMVAKKAMVEGWKADAAENIGAADKQWPDVQQQAAQQP
jgi:hypothetical protein